MNDSQAMVAQSAKLAQQASDIERQLAIARHALRQFAVCDLNERNCADLNVASKRIRNIAKLALRDIGTGAVVSLETYTTAVDALRPFAKMFRSSDLAELALQRGTGCDATYIFERDFGRAFEIACDYDCQPEHEPDAQPGADEVFGDS